MRYTTYMEHAPHMESDDIANAELEDIRGELSEWSETSGDPHFEFITLDTLEPKDIELFRSFLVGSLTEEEIKVREGEIEEEQAEGVSDDAIESRVHFCTMLREKLSTDTADRRIDHKKSA